MGLNSTLTRILNDPGATERLILEADVHERKQCIAKGHMLSEETDAPVIDIHKNTDQRLILVTQDKTLLTLKRNIARLGKREWIAPLSTLTTIMIALITSNFKQALGLGPAEWRAIFIVCGFIAAGWLFTALKHSINSDSFHDVISNICYELGAREKNPENNTLSASSVVAACKARKKKSTKRRS
tara:strand:- start:184 stop:738 length:555 start_codon:yes stop_codon:yes gene_type:complete